MPGQPAPEPVEGWDEPKESFADAPESIASARARRDGNGAALTTRDILVDALRAIDRGEIEPTAAVLVMRVPCGESEAWHLNVRDAGLTMPEVVGILAIAQTDVTLGSQQ